MTALEDVVPLAVALGEPGNDVAPGARVLHLVAGGEGLAMLAEGGEVGSPLLDAAALAVGPGHAIVIDYAADRVLVVDDPAALARGEPVAVRVEPAVVLGNLGPLGGDGSDEP